MWFMLKALSEAYIGIRKSHLFIPCTISLLLQNQLFHVYYSFDIRSHRLQSGMRRRQFEQTIPVSVSPCIVSIGTSSFCRLKMIAESTTTITRWSLALSLIKTHTLYEHCGRGRLKPCQDGLNVIILCMCSVSSVCV